MLRWIEHEGYDVTYITDIDTHEVSAACSGKAYFPSVTMSTVRADASERYSSARAQVSAWIFGGNYAYWPTQFLRFTRDTEPHAGGDKTHGQT